MLNGINRLLERDLEKLKSKYVSMKNRKQTDLPKPKVSYGGFDYFSEDDIQSSYGIGAITDKRYHILLQELEEQQKLNKTSSMEYDRIIQFIDDVLNAFKKNNQETNHGTN